MPTSDSNTRLYRLSQEISKRCNVPPAVVERVLVALVGVALETVGRGERFVFPHLMSITPTIQRIRVPHTEKSGTQKQVKLYDNKTILRVGLSGTIRRLNTAQQELWSDQPGLVNAATWRDALAYLKQTKVWSRDADETHTPEELKAISQRFKPQATTAVDVVDPLFDALLGDDDDDI